MKKTKIDNVEVYTHDYKGYKFIISLVDDKLANYTIISPNEDELAQGDIYDDKNPNGTPNTPHFRKKIQTELEELIEEEVLKLSQEIQLEKTEEVN